MMLDVLLRPRYIAVIGHTVCSEVVVVVHRLFHCAHRISIWKTANLTRLVAPPCLIWYANSCRWASALRLVMTQGGWQVETLGVQVMVVWYSLLLEHRVLVCGKGVPAGTVGQVRVQPACPWWGLVTDWWLHPLAFACAKQACLAIPLLGKPLRGFERYLCPYVALTDLEPVMCKPYICGTTNQLFATRKDWWDCLVDLSDSSVAHSGKITVAGDDLSFIKHVLEALPSQHPDECVAWACDLPRAPMHGGRGAQRLVVVCLPQQRGVGAPAVPQPHHKRAETSFCWC